MTATPILPGPQLDSVEQAIKDIATGRPVVVVDDADRENEGDLVFAAEAATPELLAFTIRHARGLICVPMVSEDLDRLNLPQMTSDNQEHMGTAFTVSVDARAGITTGISAADRARTITLLADPATAATDFVRPGHLFPLRYTEGGVLRRRGHTEAAVDLAKLAGLRPAGVVTEIVNEDGTMARLPRLREFADEHGLQLISIEQLIHLFPLRYTEGGVLRRRGHTEAAVDLAKLAGLRPAGVVTEIVNEDGTMARLPRLREFADEHGLQLISIEQLIEYRRRTETVVTQQARTVLPNAYGDWQACGYRNAVDGTEHMALVLGDLDDGEDVLVRVHSECLTGDVFGSLRCDCGAQLDAAMALIAAEGRGVVLYLRGHEGRGIGLVSKLRAYQLQDQGSDTVDANLELGLPVDARDYSTGAQILADLGVQSARLLTNNPDKVAGLARFGLDVTPVPLPVPVTAYNLRYLAAKRDRLGHTIDNLPQTVAGPARSARESA